MALNNCGIESTRGITLLMEWPYDSSTYVQVEAIEQMPEIEMTAETEECSDDAYATENEGFKEYSKTGVFDTNEAQFTLNWKSGNTMHDAMRTAFRDVDNAYRFRIQYTDTALTKDDFEALVSGQGHPLPGNGGKVTQTHTLRISGDVVRTET